jgi:hypothetical protein
MFANVSGKWYDRFLDGLIDAIRTDGIESLGPVAAVALIVAGGWFLTWTWLRRPTPDSRPANDPPMDVSNLPRFPGPTDP